MENIIKIEPFKTAYGELLLGDFDNKLCLCDWQYRKMRSKIDNRIKQGLQAQYKEQNSDIIDQTKTQLNEYFSGNREEFDIPLLMVGTNFQKSVWNQLMKLKYGHTDTYQGLSTSLNKLKAIRAVAAANGANAISIIVPCHRIIGSNGKLVGYAGGIAVKSKLLKLEGYNTTKQLDLFD